MDRSAGPGGPAVSLIVIAMRSHPPGANVVLARTAAGFGAPVVGFDLAGLEAEWPAPPHAAAFRAAEAGGLRLTVTPARCRAPTRSGKRSTWGRRVSPTA